MRVVVRKSAMRPQLLAEVVRTSDRDDTAVLALLVGIDVSDDEILELLAGELSGEELAQVRAALDLGPDPTA
jgi:hypothetical protein